MCEGEGSASSTQWIKIITKYSPYVNWLVVEYEKVSASPQDPLCDKSDSDVHSLRHFRGKQDDSFQILCLVWMNLSSHSAVKSTPLFFFKDKITEEQFNYKSFMSTLYIALKLVMQTIWEESIHNIMLLIMHSSIFEIVVKRVLHFRAKMTLKGFHFQSTKPD